MSSLSIRHLQNLSSKLNPEMDKIMLGMNVNTTEGFIYKQIPNFKTINLIVNTSRQMNIIFKVKEKGK